MFKEQNQSIIWCFLVPLLNIVLSDKIETAIASLHENDKDFVTTQYGKRWRLIEKAWICISESLITCSQWCHMTTVEHCLMDSPQWTQYTFHCRGSLAWGYTVLFTLLKYPSAVYALGREWLFIVPCFPYQMVATTKIVAADSKTGVLCLVIPNTREYATWLMIRCHSVFMVYCGHINSEQNNLN